MRLPARLAPVLLLLAAAPAAARAEPERLTGAEIAAVLTGNTVDGLWGGTPYRSYFDASGLTLYRPEGRPAERGRWRADQERDLYCSHWERSGWSCYEIYREGETIIWALPGGGSRTRSTLLQGDQLRP